MCPTELLKELLKMKIPEPHSTLKNLNVESCGPGTVFYFIVKSEVTLWLSQTHETLAWRNRMQLGHQAFLFYENDTQDCCVILI